MPFLHGITPFFNLSLVIILSSHYYIFNYYYNKYKLRPPHSLFSRGDSAITIDLGDRIDEELNRQAMAIRDWLVARPIPGVQDIIVAYSSVSVFYDPVLISEGIVAGEEGNPGEDCGGIAFGYMKQRLEQAGEEAVPLSGEDGKTIAVPVCYGGRFGPDLEPVSAAKGISPQEIIDIHSSRIYRVYMIGFLPGFAYLGKVDERLDMPRKAAPTPVVAGSVGIVGNQSGIYPLNSPGGWHIIGLTPLKLFDAQGEPPVLLKTGDRVQFFPITAVEFDQLSREAQPVV